MSGPLEPSSSADERPDATIAFSVIVATFNGAKTLGAALDALSRQTISEPFEVIVVNDASTDATTSIAATHDVRLISISTNGGHGHAMNVGLEHARGTYLAFMDDDCVPPDEWLANLLRAWSSVGPSVTMIGGPVLPLDTDTLNRRYVGYRRPLRAQESQLSDEAGLVTRLRHAYFPPSPPEVQRSIYFPVGANMSIRAEAARQTEGFTEERGAGEEEFIAKQLRRTFGPDTAQYFPDVIMRHDFDHSLNDSLRRASMYGASRGREWVRDRDIPSVRPIPVTTAALFGLLCLVNVPIAFVALLLSPLLFYRRWLPTIRGGNSAEAVVYPYLEAIEDVASDIGFFKGAVRALRKR